MKSTLLPEWESGFSIPLIQPLNPKYAKVTLKYRILMDSKNPMRAGMLELGEQIKQKFSREKNCEENMKRF